MRIPLIAGRPLDARDDATAPLRVVISERLAERLFFTGSPVGQHVWIAALKRDAEIVGVVGDVAHRALDETPLQTIYLSAWQSPSRSSRIVIRRTRSSADIADTVREEVARLDGDLPVYGQRSMQEIVALSPGVPARRILTATFVGFALLAVALGAIGLFGIVAHDVARRRTELALRMALGADPMRILNTTLRQGPLILALGLAVGALLSVWATHALGAMLSGTSRPDIASIAVASAVLFVASLAAILPAAVRAARIDPVIALRAE